MSGKWRQQMKVSCCFASCNIHEAMRCQVLNPRLVTLEAPLHNSSRRNITLLSAKQYNLGTGVSILQLPVPRGGATLRTGCDEWQRRNYIISVSTKRKEKWRENLASFFFIVYQYTLLLPVLCVVQEVCTFLYLSRHPSAPRRTDRRTCRDSGE
jgi:hypothetical protein